MNIIRGIVTAVQEGLIKRFSAAGRSGETISNREHIQHYGFTSRPLSGAEMVIIRDGNQYIAIASDDRRYRLAVEDGEVALYTDEGDKIHLKRDNTIEVVSGNKLIGTVENEVDITTKVAKVSASVSCEVTSPAVTVNAATSYIVNSPLVLLGEGTLRRLLDERAIAAYNSHVHPYGGVPDQQLSEVNHCTKDAQAS